MKEKHKRDAAFFYEGTQNDKAKQEEKKFKSKEALCGRVKASNQEKNKQASS